MKTFSLLFLIAFISNPAFSQIQPFLGIYDLDSCKLENPCHFLEIDTLNQDIWQIGTPSKSFFDTAYSFSRAVMTDTVNAYDTSKHSYFEIGFPISNLSLIVGFKHKYQTDSLLDGSYIEVSYDNGLSWSNIIYPNPTNNPLNLITENMYKKSDTLINGISCFTGTSNGWVYSRIQWIWGFNAKGIPDSTLLRFYFLSDSIQTNKAGWMIDDIFISYVQLPASIPEVEDSESVHVYPNPFSDFTTFEFENREKENYTLLIYDCQGRILRTKENIISGEVRIDRGKLSSGLYFYQLYLKGTPQAFGKIIIR